MDSVLTNFVGARLAVMGSHLMYGDLTNFTGLKLLVRIEPEKKHSVSQTWICGNTRFASSLKLARYFSGSSGCGVLKTGKSNMLSSIYTGLIGLSFSHLYCSENAIMILVVNMPSGDHHFQEIP